FGWSVSGAGDVDGDGNADVVVSGPQLVFNDPNTVAGGAAVYYGVHGGGGAAFRGPPLPGSFSGGWQFGPSGAGGPGRERRRRREPSRRLHHEGPSSRRVALRAGPCRCGRAASQPLLRVAFTGVPSSPARARLQSGERPSRDGNARYMNQETRFTQTT